MSDDNEPEPMTHTMKLRVVTRGPAPYGHKSWWEAVEAILSSELVGVVEVKVLEDWI